MPDRDRFPGTWRLLSYQTMLPDGSVEHPFGGDPVGLLIYTQAGHMSGQVMRSGRTDLPMGYRRTGPVAAVHEAFDGYIAYCGTYQVDQEASEVIHQVEASLFPNWVRTQQKREYRFDAEKLTLTARSSRNGVARVNQLIWTREA